MRKRRLAPKRVYIGIDPGVSGAIACLPSEEVHDWPGDVVSASEIVKGIIEENIGCEIIAAIERVHAMQKAAAGTTFKFGCNFGCWQGILSALNIPFREVSPKDWQKGVVFKKKGQSKDKGPNIEAARKLFPNAEITGPKGGLKDGRADALLIADWCRRNS